jgi:hypothetical protein
MSSNSQPKPCNETHTQSGKKVSKSATGYTDQTTPCIQVAHPALKSRLSNWQTSLENFCKRNNLTYNSRDPICIEAAAQQLLKKNDAYSRRELEELRNAAPQNSPLAKVLSRAITAKMLTETSRQIEDYINGGGRREDALRFFARNDGFQHIDALLQVADKDSQIGKFLTEAKRREKIA